MHWPLDGSVPATTKWVCADRACDHQEFGYPDYALGEGRCDSHPGLKLVREVDGEPDGQTAG